MLWQWIFCLGFLSRNISQANELVDLKIEKRNDYQRIIFYLQQKPIYHIFQQDKKIHLLLENTKISLTPNALSDLIAHVGTIEVRNSAMGNSEIVLNYFPQGLKRYLYQNRPEGQRFFSLVVDLYEYEWDFKRLNTLAATDSERWSTLEEVIADTTDVISLDDFMELHHISDVSVQDLEKQNNQEIDLDILLKKITSDTNRNNPYDWSYKLDKVLRRRNQEFFTVVIDAGHGGWDSGAIGPGGTAEKNVNLQFAKLLKMELVKNKKIRVQLIRSDDSYLNLNYRLRKARQLRANLLISVHADASSSKTTRGLAIYTLPKDASDRRSIFLVSKYKTSSATEVWNTMADMTRYGNLGESNRFTKILLENLNKADIRLMSYPHRRGNFAILLAPEFPSILVELGFISNEQDEQLLRSHSRQHYLAERMAEAVNSYMMFLKKY
jgi:N-acetylmuramoyl-L-alanine amidase